MNQKAKELGLQNTNFVTPHGLDEPSHYTSAYELAQITDYALRNSKFAQIVNTKVTTIHINNQPKEISNTNELLGNLQGVDGVKTGFTNNAGRCLVTSTSRNGHQIICIVLGADTKKIRTSDSIKLIEYAFSNYEYININEKIQIQLEEWKKQNLKHIKTIKGIKNVTKIATENLPYDKLPVHKNNIKDIQIQITCQNTLPAPLYQGQKIGTIQVKIKDEIIATTNILLQEEIPKKSIIDYMKQLLTHYYTNLETGFFNGMQNL